MLHLLFWIAVGICAVGQLAVLRSVVTGRAPGALAPDAARRRRAGEILWAVVPACMLAIVLALTWRAMHDRPRAVSHIEAAGALALHR